jgi:ABC-type bacteriocin/lantibiotic exporter with double-glycine peptidase domain
MLELFDHLKEFPYHKSDNTDVSMVTLQASYWVQKIKDGLDVDQQKLVELFLQGNHILLIGGAGCGKTHATKRLIRLTIALFGDEWCNNHLAGVAMTNPIANNMNFLSFEGIVLKGKITNFFNFFFFHQSFFSKDDF